MGSFLSHGGSFITARGFSICSSLVVVANRLSCSVACGILVL